MRFPAAAVYLTVLLVLPVAVSVASPPPGYYDPAEGLTGAQLQEALHDIIDGHSPISYGDIWEAFETTDDKPNGMVWDMYSDIPGGTPPYEYDFSQHGGSASGEGEGYNREHSWPQSWFDGGAPMYTDLFQIVPTDIYVNNRRGSYAYGEVNSPTWVSMNGSRLGPCVWPGYSGTAFEPRDEYKGDFARNYFYMSTRYFEEDSQWPGGPMSDGAVLLSWAVDMLMDWHQQDPVSTKELDRNDTVYGIQGNRNPFIDHPEYVFLIYDPTSTGGGVPPSPEMNILASPNPFTTFTTIRFQLPEGTDVTLTVYDACGRLVNTLHDSAPLPAGSHESYWTGSDDSGSPLPSGIYHCRIATDSFTDHCSVLLIR